jgi:hypothetical protein
MTPTPKPPMPEDALEVLLDIAADVIARSATAKPTKEQRTGAA